MTEEAYYEMHRDIIKDQAADYDPRLHGTRISPNDEFLVIGAVRYARGRATYVVRETVNWVIRHWDGLTENTRYVIARDVKEECDYREATDRSYLSQIDDPDWNRLWNHIERTQQ